MTTLLNKDIYHIVLLHSHPGDLLNIYIACRPDRSLDYYINDKITKNTVYSRGLRQYITYYTYPLPRLGHHALLGDYIGLLHNDKGPAIYLGGNNEIIEYYKCGKPHTTPTQICRLFTSAHQYDSDIIYCQITSASVCEDMGIYNEYSNIMDTIRSRNIIRFIIADSRNKMPLKYYINSVIFESINEHTINIHSKYWDGTATLKRGAHTSRTKIS